MMFSRLNVLNVFSIYDIFNLQWVYWDITPSQGFPGGSEIKNPPANEGDLGSIPGLGRSPGEGNGNPFQYSCLGNPVDREAWWATAHGVTKESDMTQRLNNNHPIMNEGKSVFLFLARRGRNKPQPLSPFIKKLTPRLSLLTRSWRGDSSALPSGMWLGSSHPLLPRSLRPDAGESFIEKLSIRGFLSQL